MCLLGDPATFVCDNATLNINVYNVVVVLAAAAVAVAVAEPVAVAAGAVVIVVVGAALSGAVADDLSMHRLSATAQLLTIITCAKSQLLKSLHELGTCMC